MGDYRLSVLARAQAKDIARFTAKQFGVYQAKAYHAGLERTFGLLADFPKIGAEVGELFAGARRFRFQSHLVFYTGVRLRPHPRPDTCFTATAPKSL